LLLEFQAAWLSLAGARDENERGRAMLTTRQKTLRKFWYATMPVSYLAEDPNRSG
jgi:hypothetical protein